MQDLAQSWLLRSAPVEAAQAAGRPIVALESTIIAHGMPYPHNVRTAREIEALIRGMGAEPATIAVMGGKIRIGLSDDELELLGRSPDVQKVSRRDLPAVLASGGLGATTVAGTMICAALAGIEVFVTGGIGGVHRGAQETFDISADLQELARTSVAVVCAGAKSILDIGLTLEYLETHGVPVLSCEQDNFAAFYTRDSGFRADYRLDDPAEQARFLRAKWDLGLAGGGLGATTVAGTMICAALAGIEVFVTGGIGGVHRGAPETFDISADLQELAKTSVAVVCAGAKSILDIGLTLEYLETHGVPVLACGQDNFPAFYTRDSGFRADFRIDDPAQQARFIRAKWDLGLAGGVVLATPVPQAAAMPREEIDAITEQALAEAARQGIAGKALTPYLLDRIQALTGGRSLATNIALVKHNAEVGARLALALAVT